MRAEIFVHNYGNWDFTKIPNSMTEKERESKKSLYQHATSFYRQIHKPNQYLQEVFWCHVFLQIPILATSAFGGKWNTGFLWDQGWGRAQRVRGVCMQSPLPEAPSSVFAWRREGKILHEIRKTPVWRKYNEEGKVFGTTYDFKYLFLINHTQLPPVLSGNKGIPISK